MAEHTDQLDSIGGLIAARASAIALRTPLRVASPEMPVEPKAVQQERRATAVARRKDALNGQIGERYRDADFGSFVVQHPGQAEAVKAAREFSAELRENISRGVSVLLFGSVGTGKDHFLAALMYAAIDLGATVAWRNGAGLFSSLRSAMDRGRPEDEILRPLVESNVLAISDPLPDECPLTAYQRGVLFDVIDRRYRARRPTWLTVNVENRADAESRIGTAIIDRLGEDCFSLEMRWPSYRRGATR